MVTIVLSYFDLHFKYWNYFEKLIVIRHGTKFALNYAIRMPD
ncbi:hypothetical protein SBDP1_440024 [Syntrophobacter sp. SbD1]|nr:hypothetical protein SBDP1_440024 [Syntrophobacter sp. SbD1]